MANTRFSNPILYAGRGNGRGAFEDLPMGLGSIDHVVIWDDFTGIAVDSTNDWTVVKDSGASVGITADTANGYGNLTSTATTDDDGASIQGNEIFLPAAGRTIWFMTRLQNNDADQTDVCVGLTANFATNPEAMLTASNRIVFQIADGDASILCKTESGDTETSTDSGVDLADNTDVDLAFRVTGTGLVQFFINGNLVATHTTNIPATELAPAAMSLSGNDTGTRATLIDYILTAQTR